MPPVNKIQESIIFVADVLENEVAFEVEFKEMIALPKSRSKGD
jgi:hypothetical protein